MVKYESIYSFFACPKNESRKDTSVKEKLFYNQEIKKISKLTSFKQLIFLRFSFIFHLHFYLNEGEKQQQEDIGAIELKR